MKKLMLFVLLSISFLSCRQNLTKEELNSRNAAQSVVEKYLSDVVRNKNYIVFSAGDDQFVFLIQDNDTFHEYYIDQSKEQGQMVIRDTVIEGNEDLFSKMFDRDLYRKEYISFRSDFYKNGYDVSSGNITYFAFVTKDHTRLGESRLSMFVKPTPMAPEIYLYFVNRILKNAEKS